MTENLCFKKSYKAMGHQFSFSCFPQNFHTKQDVEALFDEAAREVKRIEDKFTDFKPSHFNRINELAGVRPCEVDEETLNLIDKALEVSRQSKGSFDISFASLGHEWRKAKAAGAPLSEEKRNELKTFIDYRRVEVDRKNGTVYLPHEKMRIGLGGIGKGYAVDRAFELLKERGLYNFLVNGSGDLRAHSNPNAPRPWRFGIRNPFSQNREQSAGLLQFSNAAVATSGGYNQKIEREDNKADHHIVDPKNGGSNGEVVSATVMAETCLEADTSATIAINMGVKEALGHFDKSDTFLVLIDSSGKSHLSKKALSGFGLKGR